jgi:hypothetical protein
VFLTRHVLGLRPSLAESYVTTGVIFLLSGHFHILLDYCLGMTSWRLSGGILAFALMLPGIMLEDGVQWLWRKATSEHMRKTGTIIWIQRFIGYVWVVLWMTTITPIYNYPLQRIEGNPTYLTPWSVFKKYM